MDPAILVVGLMFFVAHGLALLFEKSAIPDILVLMVIGIIAGPVAHLSSPADFGSSGQVMSTIALVLILFEGGMTLRLDSLRSTVMRSLPLFAATFGGTITVGCLAGLFLMGLPLLESITFGCILGSISPAVVLPMAKGFGMEQDAQDVLVIETSLTDVFSIILVFSLIGWKEQGSLEIGKMFGSILSALVFAFFIGFSGSFLWLKIIGFVRRFYGVSEFLGFSGAIAALAFGFGISNKPFGAFERLGLKVQAPEATLSEGEKNFFNEVIFILKTFFFLYLGISMRFSDWAGPAMGAAIALLVIAIRVGFSLIIPSRGIKLPDRELIAVMAPKGLASAVLAGLPIQAGMAGASRMQEYCYDVVLFSILFSAILSFLLKRRIISPFLDRLFGANRGDVNGEADPKANI
jgi:NhaP-type Na+/H+ or K+/H+ antiporter